MNYDYVLQLLDAELFNKQKRLSKAISPAQFSYYSKQVDELRAAILLLKQKQDEDLQPQLKQANVRSSAEVNKEVRHKAIDLLLDVTYSWNTGGVEIPQEYVDELQLKLINIRLD